MLGRQKNKQPWERSACKPESALAWMVGLLSTTAGAACGSSSPRPGLACQRISNLPYPWEKHHEQIVIQLINRIYEPVMSGENTFHQAIGDELAISDNKAEEVMTPWPGIVEAFRNHKLTLGNRIVAPKTYEASYGRYLQRGPAAPRQGRNAARTGKELIEKV